MIDVSLLGSGGMMPLPNRFLTSCLLRIDGGLILVDCGECTQVTLRMLGWGFKAIDIICLTHFHADHISGLVGMLLTIGNSGRTQPLIIIGPAGVKDVVCSLRVIAPELPFTIDFIEVSVCCVDSFEVNGLLISTLPLDHRIACVAYSFELKRKGKFDVDKAISLNLPVCFWSKLQNGEVILYNDSYYTPDMVMGPPRRSLKVSYCTDTRPIDSIIPFVSCSDLFICEGMYGDDAKMDNAINYKHMIFSEAAYLAKEAGVLELWLTHFSPALTEPFFYADNARTIFENTLIGVDRMCTSLKFID